MAGSARSPQDPQEDSRPAAGDAQAEVEDPQQDRELILQAQAGGDLGFAAFEALVDRYRDRVYRLAFGMTKSESEAEEVVQDAFLNLFRNLDGFRGDSAPSTWIYRIASNSALMRLRTKRRKPLLSIEDQAPLSAPAQGIWPGGSWSRTPDNQVFDQELRAHIEAAIEELPKKHRIVLILRDVEGFSNAEVAEMLGLTVPTVKARLHRSRLFVRERLEKYFEEK